MDSCYSCCSCGRITAAVILMIFSLSIIVADVSGRNVSDNKKNNNCVTLYRGCSVDKGECVCGESYGCVTPYPYLDKHQCIKDIKGELNKCRREPCVHGQCVQAKHDQSRRWECSCAGSGYHGKKCDTRCPSYEDKHNLPADFPSDCVY